ncbi:MAG: ACT domain-containing protein [Desulfobulbaceae bacterium]|nr:ACT domain-containing protein [Desulfobulbaceae bacterium]
MPFTIQRVQYFYTTVRDQPGEAYKLLNLLSSMGVDQLAFSAIPVGPNSTQLAVFPEDPAKLASEAKLAGMVLDGPHHALLIQGDDELGSLAGIHQKLYEADINVYASSGVTDGRGSYGYLIYVKEDDFERAATTLGV